MRLRAASRLFLQTLRGWADALTALLLAPACAVCEQLLDRPTRGIVCADCWAAIPLLTPPVCARCGDALASLQTSAECARCRRSAPAIDIARAAGLYAGPLRHIIHAFKFDKRRSLAAPLADAMRTQAGALLIGIDWTVPVPLHRRRARQRGFNQADDLARALGTPAPVLHALRRVRDTQPQSGLPAARRHRNVRHAFALSRWCLPHAHARAPARLSASRGSAVPGSESRASTSHSSAALGLAAHGSTVRDSSSSGSMSHASGRRGSGWRMALRGMGRPAALLQGRCVLLVDDVCTTGATLNACARVLKAGGAREVRALTAARAVRTRRGESPSPRPLATVRRR